MWTNSKWNRGVSGDLSDCVPSYDDPSQYICNCTEQAVNAPGQNVCLLKRNYVGDDCEVNVQCETNLGDLSACMEGICKCSVEAVANMNGTMCLPIVNIIGGICEESQQCILGAPGQYSECV